MEQKTYFARNIGLASRDFLRSECLLANQKHFFGLSTHNSSCTRGGGVFRFDASRSPDRHACWEEQGEDDDRLTMLLIGSYERKAGKCTIKPNQLYKVDVHRGRFVREREYCLTPLTTTLASDQNLIFYQHRYDYESIDRAKLTKEAVCSLRMLCVICIYKNSEEDHQDDNDI
mmetsp:Transcript_7596/g.11500  ORF Transcript_7596/g.11500 Transcript_7596/m.11500 type:complete len:173 (+) Transcript_7596:50-568(+)